MVSTVNSRPSHYEVLGLTPEASSEEIARAFAKELTSPRAFGSLTEVTVAYETLRDPIKRRAYDISLAPAPKPEPLKFTPKAPADWAPFIARPSVTELPPIPPAPTPQAEKPHPLLERLDSNSSPAPHATASEPVRAERPKAEPVRRIDPAPPQPEPRRSPPDEAPRADAHRALHFFEEQRGHESLIGAMKWKLPALAVGGLILAIGVGAWTGINSGADGQADQPKRFATLKIASAKPLVAAGVPDTEAAKEILASEPSASPAKSLTPMQRAAETKRLLAAAVAKQAKIKASLADDGILAEEPLVAEAASVKLPLPNAVIARTIDRIGYPCGGVASAASLGGGSYKVTCTSGHSYRAAPVNGRYRFKRLG